MSSDHEGMASYICLLEERVSVEATYMYADALYLRPHELDLAT